MKYEKIWFVQSTEHRMNMKFMIQESNHSLRTACVAMAAVVSPIVTSSQFPPFLAIR